MKIVVVGPGALGLLFSAYLTKSAEKSRGRDEIILLDHRPERADFLTENGVILHRLDGRSERVGVKVVARQAETLVGARPGCVLLCVKSMALSAALRMYPELFAAARLTVFIQNGVSHLELAARAAFAPAFASTTEGANSPAVGEARHAGRGLTYFGFVDQENNHDLTLISPIVQYFSEAGLAAESRLDMRERIWHKLMINVGINALTAVHNCPNGDVPRHPELRARMAALVAEARLVALAQGIQVTANVFDDVLAVCRATEANISSMLQDVRAGRPTEIEAMNGAIVRIGEQLGIATPANAAITKQVRALV
ncbi:MAG: ketopantoate reductase family protein [Desulfobulbaceae bacterium]|jgi:2-dehydropantoate 2-reductase|nr:ketopantoate reductase family protein [Desulfobulbaceae bacterium]